MKKLYTLFSGILLSATMFAQGSIQNITIDPVSPSIMDSVTAYVTVVFTLSSCTVYQQTQSSSGDSTIASALHCQGLTSDSCSTVDTFKLGHLPAGNHFFRYILNSGIGGPPCTPGLLPDATDSVNFFVTSPLGISSNRATTNNAVLSPNPFSSSAFLKIDPSVKLQDAELTIVSLVGKTIRTITNIRSNEIIIDRNDLTGGIYFYQLTQNKNKITSGRFVVE